MTLIPGEGRHFITRTPDRFDLIQITGVDTLSAQSSGAYVLAENYLYTVEAFRDYLRHLTPHGMLSITTGHLDDNNPNATGRMVSVAQQALLESGIDRPEDHIAVIRSNILYADVLIRPAPFEAGEVQRLADGSQQLRFTPLHLPGRHGWGALLSIRSPCAAEQETPARARSAVG